MTTVQLPPPFSRPPSVPDVLVASRLRTALRARDLWHENSRRAVRKPAPIFIYHAVTPEGNASSDPYVLSETLFRQHLAVLEAARCETLRLGDILDRTPADDSIALTFDDGCVSWFDRVAPQLAARHMRATFFVIADRRSGFRGSVASAHDLSWTALRSIAETRDPFGNFLFDIGSHALRHIDLSRRLAEAGPARLRDELRIARETIEQQVGRACRMLALPGGKSGRDDTSRALLRKIACEAGYHLVRDSQPRYDRCIHTSYLGGTAIYAHTTPAMLRFELRRVRQGNLINAAQWLWLRGRGQWIERADTPAPVRRVVRTARRVSTTRAACAPARPLQLAWHMPRLMRCGCGMSRRIRDMAIGLRQSGHLIQYVVASDATDVSDVGLDGIPLQHIEVGSEPVLHWSLQARRRQRRAARIAESVDSHADVVLTTQPEFAASLRRQRPRQPIVLICCGTQLLYEYCDANDPGNGSILRRAPQHLNRLLMRRAERAGFHAATAVVFDSPMTRDVVIRTYALPQDTCHVVAPSVDVQRFAPLHAAARLELRRSLGLPDDGLVVCWTGRMEDRKNVELLIDAVARSSDHVERLLLVGDGADRPQLEARVRRHGLSGIARFEGMREDVLPFLQAADAFVLPSLVESFGISLIEAMACGLPCIGLAGEGVRSNAPALIQQGTSGFITSPVAGELAACLNALAADTALRRSMGAAARQHVVHNYPSGHEVAKLETILDGLV